MKTTLVLQMLALPLLAAAGGPIRIMHCHTRQDKCIQQLTSNPARTADCEGFFRRTHFLPPVTSSKTVSETWTPTATYSITVTTEAPGGTATNSFGVTRTDTDTITQTTTSSTQLPPVYVSAQRGQHVMDWGDLWAEPNIPDYASSACPGLPRDPEASSPYKRYMSACSCIGVPYTEITPAQSVVTATVTMTSTAPGETTTMTVATDSTQGVFTTISVTVTEATETMTVSTTATSTQTLEGPRSTYSLIASYRDFCIPRGYIEEKLPLEAVSTPEQAFETCAKLCDADPVCLQIWIGSNKDKTVFSCDLGSGRPTQKGWDASFVQCGLYHKPFLRLGDWYQSKYAPRDGAPGPDSVAK